jgi:cytochrome c oxidase subunit II
MFEDFPLFPERASTIAGKVDALFITLIIGSATLAIGIVITLIVFAIRYRRRSETERPKPITGSLLLELTWTIIQLFMVLGMFTWGSYVFFQMSRPPAGSMDIYVVGKQWMWKFQHMNGVREINELHVPIGRPVRLTMASEDVIHSLYFPAFRIKGDVVPGRYREMWFQATKTGKYHIFCAEYCGTKHAGMGGWITVMEPANFQAWLSGGPSGGPLEESGEKLFTQLACNTCHFMDHIGRGPILSGLFGKEVELQNGQTIKADESYIRESILNPQAKIVMGFQPIMPTFQGQISEEGLLQLIAYIKSLHQQTDQTTSATTTKKPVSGEVKNQ